MRQSEILKHFKNKLENDRIKVGICGLGYVGLPLARAACASNLNVVGFDIDESKIRTLTSKRSYIKHISSSLIENMIESGRFFATSDFSHISEVDVVAICVPTPLTRQREPNLDYVVQTAKSVAKHARRGQLVVLESTTYPGTTSTVLAGIFAAHGFTSGTDIFLAFSPEREDPGNSEFETMTIPKVIGGHCAVALEMAELFYSRFVKNIIPVSNPDTAEAVKLTENIFRAVNIALVNELKVIYTAMGIDVWEVINAAKTKPFGFMPFYPGPGLGGHCIPIDPFYLTWKAREFEISTRFIELAGEINHSMPAYVISRLVEALDRRFNRGLNGAKVLVLGLAYKRNVDDMRESPGLKLIELLERRGAAVDYHDPFISVIPMTREYSTFASRKSIGLQAQGLASYDAVLVATDHDQIDYDLVAQHSKLIIDTRNCMAGRGIIAENVVKA